MRAVLLALIAAPTLIPTSAQAQVVPARFCVYVDSPSLGILNGHFSATGHAFLQLLPNSGPQAGSKRLVYGFAPKKTLDIINAIGEVSDNGTHHWDYKICYPVTPAQYDRMEARVRNDLARPANYDLFGFNCTDWVLSVARLGGLTVPRAGPGRLFIRSDPEILENSLRRIGVGRQFAGGVVRRNPGNVAPNNGIDPRSLALDVDSYTGVVEFGLVEPGRLVAGTHLVNDEVRLASPVIGPHQPLSLRFDGLRSNDAIIAVDWGDGTMTYQHTTATHRFDRPGRHSVRVLVVRNAILFRATFDADVMAGGGHEEIALRTPRSHPRPAFPPLPLGIVPLPL